MRRRVVAATLLPCLGDLRRDIDPLDAVRLSDLPQPRALRLQLDIHLRRDSITHGTDVLRCPRGLCVAEDHPRVARESCRIEAGIRSADVPDSVIQAGATAGILLGRRSIGRRVYAARTTRRRMRRRLWVRGVETAKDNQQHNAAAEQQIEEAEADSSIDAEASDQRSGDQPTGGKAGKRTQRRGRAGRDCCRSARVSQLWLGSVRRATHACRVGARATATERAATPARAIASFYADVRRGNQ